MGQIVFANNGTTRMTTTKQYDFLNRLTSISSVGPQPSTINSYNYQLNQANQRTRVTLADGSSWLYTYGALGQVISGAKFWADQTPVAGQQFQYAFDTIGNRTAIKAGGDQNGQNLRSATYTANNLNQYTNRTVPGYVDVMGLGLATTAVTVNGQTAYRKGEYFRQQLSVTNTSLPVCELVTVAATNQTSLTGNLFVPKTPEVFGYDPDGNLTTDGRWNYTWDAENRLVGMTNNTSVGPQQGLQFGYDWKSRRIQKQVWSQASAPTNNATFVYDGWNPIAQLNASNSAVIQSYVWGLDLSGSPQGAGGVGGLLEVSDPANGIHFAAYDGNGNVTALVNASSGTTSALYQYGPFGELLRATGPMAKANPFRFSTKYHDDETDLVYYGYRYLSTSTARWLSRDPLAEQTNWLLAPPTIPRAAGKIQYLYAENNPLCKVDFLGLFSDTQSMRGHGTISVLIAPEKIDMPRDYARTIASLITWTPPNGGNWDNICGCKPCVRTEWRQQIEWGSNRGIGSWKDDNYDPTHGLAVVPWDCDAKQKGLDINGRSASADQAATEDHPGLTSKLGAWTFWIVGSYYIHVRTKITCVEGPEKGVVYWSVYWGGFWNWDQRPQLYPTLIWGGDWRE